MSSEVVQTPFGKFLVDEEDLIGSTTKAGTLWDGPGFLQPIAEEFGGLGQRGVTILDVGANQGAFSVWLANRGAWRVIAVEPVPSTMQRLKANLDLNREVTASVVIPLEVAAYHNRLQMDFVSPIDPGNTGGTALTAEHGGPIRACPLDDFRFCFGDRVSLIKVDTQGCDAAALLGLACTIIRHQPAIVFEWEADLAKAHGLSWDHLHQWLTKDLSYTVEPWPTHLNNYLALPRR